MIPVPYLNQDAAPVRGEPEPDPGLARFALGPAPPLPGDTGLPRDTGRRAYRVGDELRNEQFHGVDEGGHLPSAEGVPGMQPGATGGRGSRPQFGMATQRPPLRACRRPVRQPQERGWCWDRTDLRDGHRCPELPPTR